MRSSKPEGYLRIFSAFFLIGLGIGMAKGCSDTPAASLGSLEARLPEDLHYIFDPASGEYEVQLVFNGRTMYKRLIGSNMVALAKSVADAKPAPSFSDHLPYGELGGFLAGIAGTKLISIWSPEATEVAKRATRPRPVSAMTFKRIAIATAGAVSGYSAGHWMTSRTGNPYETPYVRAWLEKETTSLLLDELAAARFFAFFRIEEPLAGDETFGGPLVPENLRAFDLRVLPRKDQEALAELTFAAFHFGMRGRRVKNGQILSAAPERWNSERVTLVRTWQLYLYNLFLRHPTFLRSGWRIVASTDFDPRAMPVPEIGSFQPKPEKKITFEEWLEKHRKESDVTRFLTPKNKSKKK